MTLHSVHINYSSCSKGIIIVYKLGLQSLTVEAI